MICKRASEGILLLSALMYWTDAKHHGLLQYTFIKLPPYRGAKPLSIFMNGGPMFYNINETVSLWCEISPNEATPSVEYISWTGPLGDFSYLSHFHENTHRYRLKPLKDGKQSIVIIKANREDEGNYTCEAKVAGHPLLRQSVQAAMIRPVKFENAPPKQYPRVGQYWLVVCMASGHPSPRIDWLVNGTRIPQGGRFRMLPDGLHIKAVSFADSGEYTCRATVNETKVVLMTNITVLVVDPPSFPQLMNTQMYQVGEGKKSTMMSCIATGFPLPEVTWFHAETDQELSNYTYDNGRFRHETISLPGELHMRIRNPTRKDKGLHKCVAKNHAGVAEHFFNVTVIEKPWFQFLNDNITAHEGKEAIIRCVVGGNPDDIDFVYAGVRRVVNDSRHAVLRDGDSLTLIIHNLELSDEGVYQCWAKNQAAESHKSLELTVQFKARFKFINMTPPTTCIGSSAPVNFTCATSANPNASVFWEKVQFERPFKRSFLKNSSNVIISTFDYGTASILLVSPTSTADFATYSCLAISSVGESRHNFRFGPPQAPGAIPYLGTDSITPRSVRFYLQGPFEPGNTNLQGYEAHIDSSFSQEDPYHWRTLFFPIGKPYLITGLNPAERYRFRFRAKNCEGSGPLSREFVVELPNTRPPEAPEPLKTDIAGIASSGASQFYLLQWKTPEDGGEWISEYLVTYWMEGKEGAKQSVAVRSPSTWYNFTGLENGHRYHVQIAAKNKRGTGPALEVLIQAGEGGSKPYQVKPAEATTLWIIVVGCVAAAAILLTLDVALFLTKNKGITATIRKHSCCREGTRSSD